MAEIFCSAFFKRSFAKRSTSDGFTSQPRDVLTASSSPLRASCVTHCPEVPIIAPACDGDSQLSTSLIPLDSSDTSYLPSERVQKDIANNSHEQTCSI